MTSQLHEVEKRLKYYLKSVVLFIGQNVQRKKKLTVYFSSLLHVLLENWINLRI